MYTKEKSINNIDSTSSLSREGRLSVDTRLWISACSFSSLMPAHVSRGRENKSTVRTSGVDGCITLQQPWSKTHRVLGSVWHEGTSISTPCSVPSAITVPDTTVTGFSPFAFKSFVLVLLQHTLLAFPVKSSAPWQQTRAAISGSPSLSPKDVISLQDELSEASHLVTCLNNSVSCTCFNISSWIPKLKSSRSEIYLLFIILLEEV